MSWKRWICARWLPLALLLAAGLLGAALTASCGEGGGEEAPEISAASESPALPPTPEAVPLERFRYVAKLTMREQRDRDPREVSVSTEGAFQAPDRHSLTHTIHLGGVDIKQSLVMIGDEAWIKHGDGRWTKVARDDERVTELIDNAFSAIRPNFLGGADFRRVRESVRRLPATDEIVNGVPASHYRVGELGREFLEQFLEGEQVIRNVRDLRWELWLAQDGVWPVRVLATARIGEDLKILDQLDLRAPTTWSLTVDISAPNDPSLVVAPPEAP